MSTVPAAELLRVDVDAAVANLGSELAHGPWQVPTELVRLAVRRGACRVDLALHRRGFRLAAAGELELAAELRWLAAAVDTSAASRARQQAVDRLEEAGAQVLLGAATMPRGRLAVELAGTSGPLVVRRGAVVRWPRGGLRAAGADLVIDVTAAGWSQRRARTWLAACCRFAAIPVSLDGVDLRAGFRRAGFALRVATPLPTSLLVGAGGEAPTLWLLQHGVVSSRVTVPRFPPFQAAVELGGLVPDGATPGALRAAVSPYLNELVTLAAETMLRLAERPSGIAPEIRSQLAAALLVAARRRVLAARIMAADFIPWVAAGRRSLVSPAWLASRAGSERGGLVAADEGSGVSAAVPHVELGARARADLAAVTGIRLHTAPAPLRLRRTAWRRWWQRGGDVVAAWLARRHGAAVSRAELSGAERRFLALLEDRGRDGGTHRPVGFHRGRRGRRRGPDGELLLPRRDALVRAAVAAVATDPRWLPLALRAVAGDTAAGE